MPTARARQIDPLKMEVSCAILAKAQQHVPDVSAGTCKARTELRRGQHRDFHSKLCNGMVRFSSHQRQAAQAERWMGHLNHKCGDVAEIESFNMLLQSLIEKGDLEKADAWFQRTRQGALHPELGNLRPNRGSFDVMIQGSAKADDLGRAERYLMDLLERTSDRPHRNSFREVIWALLRAGEHKRAHVWAEDFVSKGCADWPNYDPDVVRKCYKELRHRRTYNVEEHFELIQALVKALASAGNTVSANKWLQYLVKCGQRPSQSVETWDMVRAATPKEILPARLYCEEPSERPFGLPEANQQGFEMWRDRAPLELPALLSGEREEDRHRYILQLQEQVACAEPGEVPVDISEPLEKRGCSQASTRAETFLASRPTTAAAEQGRGSARTSLGLQKSLQMKWQQEKIAQANSARELCRQAAAERSHTSEAKGRSATPPEGSQEQEAVSKRPATS